MFFVRLILLFILFLSIIRVAYDGVRLSVCLIAEKHFNTTPLSSTVTAASVSYIIALSICGLP